ncbi:alpha/beta fold hydrolase [Polynucleobacter sp. MWH-Braz-FAM2G]|uniref:alpha/beta fold hydrolase n=1 Tax=Polynucleobacter sp. MWH-Braz-FAM2G TaxID=1855883 RepID=UPI00203C43AA|nr:alpha/beta hydrolase [Polynucleobacter sp. MWH-Braz-FAM2G]QWD91723.1 alpha/beta hydrolase [Polynucleobacter sp. MWH-Braz-FAM2G]
MAFTDKTITTEHGEIFIREWNPHFIDLSPIVLIHDSLGCTELWRNFPSELSEITKRRVIAYDRLGFGKSGVMHKPISKQFISDEASNTFSNILQHLGIGHFVVLGHSVGGGMALHCAAQLPERCDAVITISAQSFVEERTLNGIRVAQTLFNDPAQVDRLKKYHGEKAQWVLDSWIHTWLADSFSNWSLSEMLANVKAKLLVIHGVDDEYGSMEHPQRIVDLSGGKSILMPLENTAHFPHREQTPIVLDAIKNFLD